MSRNSEGMSENASKLLELARKKFADLNEAEEKLFRSVADGEVADRSDKSGENNDPNEAKDWDPNTRVIRDECITWLCTDRQASEMVTHKGIRINSARIDKELDLSYAIVTFPLVFEKSAFPEGINLRNAEIRNLNLGGTHTGPIYGDGLKVEGDINLRNGFKSEGKVRLYGATIGGSLDCRNGQFINKDSEAIIADGLNVNGSIFLNEGFKAEGQVRLYGAKIHVNLDCIKGWFINRNAKALIAERLDVSGSVFLRNGFKAEGEVNLVGATIGGNLDCEEGQFISKVRYHYALRAENMNVKGNVYLHDGFTAKGGVNLVGATIGGDLVCEKGNFINESATALSVSSANIEGSVYLSFGFKAKGEVDLCYATIGGFLICDSGEFIYDIKGATAIIANFANIKANVFLRSFKALGGVSLVGATIDGTFNWLNVKSPEEITLDLRHAKIGTLYDHSNSWPGPDKLFLHGLVYDEISDYATRDAESRIEWLKRQKDFWPQPYEQLAAVLRKGGEDEDAKRILIAKNQDKARLTKLTWSEWIWYRILGPMIGYGYRPLNALWGVLFFVVLGWILFGTGYWGGLITPHSESAYVEISVKTDDGEIKRKELSDVYPRFNFLMYSVDTFVPLIDLHQSKYWLPNANRGYELLNIKGVSLHFGSLLRFYLWIHIAMGWILSTLLVVGLTGLVRT